MLHITAGAIEITDRLVLITVNVIRIIAAALSSGVVAALMTSEAILLAAGRAVIAAGIVTTTSIAFPVTSRATQIEIGAGWRTSAHVLIRHSVGKCGKRVILVMRLFLGLRMVDWGIYCRFARILINMIRGII